MLTTAPPPVGRHNPFATRFTRPGAVPPLDSLGLPLDVAALARRARCLGVSAIEGMHGAGKSTLLAALASTLADSGLLAGRIRSRSRRDGPIVARAVFRSRPGTMLCVDGWETLGVLQGALVSHVARYRGVGLIVTVHRPGRMATLVHCTTSPALLGRIVADLPDHGGLIAAEDVVDAYAAHGGNLREALYDLYDRFERRCRDR